MNTNTLAADKDDREDATSDHHMDLPLRSFRTVIPPVKLGDYVWKGGGTRK